MSYNIEGLAPQKVAESKSEWATAWINQRKTFFDGEYFWVFYYYGYAPEVDPTYPHVRYTVSSKDGVTWGDPQFFLRTTVADHFYLGQGFDIRWDASLGKAIASVPYEDYFYWSRIGTTNGVLTREVMGCPQSIVGYFIVSPRHSYIEDYVLSYHQAVRPALSLKLGDMIARNVRDVSGVYPQAGVIKAGPFGTYSDVNGGSLTLRYNNDTAIYVVKDGDNTLHWGFMNTTFITFPPNSLETELSSGLNSLSGCEIELDSGIVNQHIVYIKSTGELSYRKFENDDWGAEKVLVQSGASYPVIACGSNGKLYVFYVKNEKIWISLYDGDAWHDPVEFFTDQHTYNNPAYLSTNQNAQNGKICLVWTEGSGTPYEVWFSYITSVTPLPSPTITIVRGKSKLVKPALLIDYWSSYLDYGTIRSAIQQALEETKPISASIKKSFEETINVKAKIAEVFEESMPLTASVLQEFTMDIPIKGSIIKSFQETASTTADIMKAIIHDELRVSAKVTPLREKFRELKRKIRKI